VKAEVDDPRALTHEVRLVPGGRSFTVRSGQTVLEASLDAGLNLPHSCKSGHCSSCRARLVAGEIEYPRGKPIGITQSEADAGLVLLCQAHARSPLVVEARRIASVASVEIKTLPCRIERLVRLAPDVMQVFLRLPAVEHLAFQPGQYLDVLLEDGRRRSFSIASPPHDAELLELHVRYVPGGGFTERLFTAMGTGTLLRIEGPIGQFVYQHDPRPLLLVAGGTGFAPLKSILRHILERGQLRDMHLFWGARTPADLYEEALALEWTRRYPSLRFSAVLSDVPSAAEPHHRLGLVHEAVLAEYPQLAHFDVYAAGPPAMIEAIRAAFPSHGLAEERLHFDSFDYAPPDQRSFAATAG
jgi:CDP-4-dehydro-6-deoxyglucose reductase